MSEFHYFRQSRNLLVPNGHTNIWGEGKLIDFLRGFAGGNCTRTKCRFYWQTNERKRQKRRFNWRFASGTLGREIREAPFVRCEKPCSGQRSYIVRKKRQSCSTRAKPLIQATISQPKKERNCARMGQIKRYNELKKSHKVEKWVMRVEFYSETKI